MSEAEPGGLCNNCVGACCRGRLFLPLSKEEAGTLLAVGTVLKEFLSPGDEVNWGDRRYLKANAPDAKKFVRRQAKGLDPGKGLFGLDSDCGFLEETPEGKFVCGIHNDPDLKPDVCENFTAGSLACLDIRNSVIKRMLEEDSLVPSLAGVALGQETLRNIEGL